MAESGKETSEYKLAAVSGLGIAGMLGEALLNSDGYLEMTDVVLRLGGAAIIAAMNVGYMKYRTQAKGNKIAE